MRREDPFVFDTAVHDIRGAVLALLRDADGSIVGFWPELIGNDDTDDGLLERFCVPTLTLSKEAFGGMCEGAQPYLSDHIMTHQSFLEAFHRVVVECVLPYLKKRMNKHQDETVAQTFCCQRAPTMRLQAGPSRACVKPHSDCEYGHQDGEMNFWMPLTKSARTKTTLWVESEPGTSDFRPPPKVLDYSNIGVFFGSYCRHFVPPNATPHTHVSLDFRIGIQSLGYDPEYLMLETKDDHTRRKVTM
jgi:hypothetical protein